MENQNCCGPIPLTEAETERELARLGLTAETAARPTVLELIVERDKGNITSRQFDDSLEALRQLEQGHINEAQFGERMFAIGGWES